VSYYVQGLENVTGSANVTVSAPGFSSASHAVEVVQIGVEIHGLESPTTTLSTNDTNWYVQVGTPCAGNLNLCTVQNVRAGGPPFVVTLALAPAQTPIAELRSDEPVATGQTVTKPIVPGLYYTQAVGGATVYGLTFDPISTGTTSVTVTGPAGVLTMANTGVRPVTITGPAITTFGAIIVGSRLQAGTGATLGASEHGGVTVTVQSDDPTRVLVAPNATTAGTASFTVNLPNGSTAVSYYVQGLENVTGTANVTVSAPGFSSATHAVEVVQIGVEIHSLEPAQTNLSALDTNWYVQVGTPCPGNLNLCNVQNVRAGGPAFVVTLTNSDANVARLTSDEPVQVGQVVTKPIQPNIYYTQAVLAGTTYGLAFDQLANGTTSVTVTGPAGVLTMANTGVRTVTISTPAIAPTVSVVTVGSGLQISASATLGATDHGGVTVTATSSAPSVFVVSSDTSIAGSASIGIPIANGATFIPLVIQGLENASGTGTLTLSAPGFTSASITVTVSPSAIEILNLPSSVSAGSANVVNWYVQVGLPNGQGSGLQTVQNVRAGSPGFVITLTNSTAAVAQLGSDEPATVGQTITKPILPGYYYTQAVPFGVNYGMTFDPLGPGTTTVTATGPFNVITTGQGIRTVLITP
jgi:hypothetical protein